RRRLGRLHVPSTHLKNWRREHARNGSRTRSAITAPANFRNAKQTIRSRARRARKTNRNQKSLRRTLLDERRKKFQFHPLRSIWPVDHRFYQNHRRRLQANRQRQNLRNRPNKTSSPRLLPVLRRQRRRTHLRQSPRHHNPHLPPTERPPKSHLRHHRKKS